MDAAIVLAIVVVAMILFSLERVPLEVTSLAVIAAVAISGVIPPAEAFDGISNGTVVFIFGLLAMTRGLAATGVMQLAGRRAALARRFGERTFVAGLLGTVAAFSSLASNTAVTAAFLPVASALSARAGISRSRILLPMAYASMLGGMIFLYGTSTNLVVSEAMRRLGMAPIGFAEMTPVGLPLAVVGIVLLIATNRFLVPRRREVGEEPTLAHREFFTQAVLTPQSRFVGHSVADLATGLGFSILGVVREGTWLPVSSEVKLEPQDRIVIKGTRETVLRVKDLRSMVLHAEMLLPEERQREGSVLAEAFVPPHSPLVGRTLREFLFARNLGLVPLAIHRHPGIHPGDRLPSGAMGLGDVRIGRWDVLLVSGPPARLRELEKAEWITILGGVSYTRPRYHKALLAMAIFVVAIAAAATNLIVPALAGLLGILAMLATGCMDVREAFRVDWRVLLLIGALLALGAAMEKSGAGALVAKAVVPLVESIGARGILFVLMLATVLLSAPMSNQAAALVLLPVAVQVAQQTGLDPRPFAIGTALAASCSFMTPLEPSAALVYGPGHYRFADFLRAGTPLTLLLLGLLTLLVPMRWPF